MRISDIINEASTVEQSILDYLSILAGEGLKSISISTLIAELATNDIDVDEGMLFDILNNLAIVNNIKDDVVFFSTDSGGAQVDAGEGPAKAEKTIDRMARKQTKKELGT